MQKTSMLVALCASFLLPACTLNDTAPVSEQQQSVNANAQIAGSHEFDRDVYNKSGMEVSAISSRIADDLQQNLFYYLLPDAPSEFVSGKGSVKIVTMPRLAVTSFVDTDTYENAGYLGRALAEYFTHELSARAFEVTEFKLTGAMSVTKDGEYILSRNWKKIAADTKVKYLLGGTLTRNDKGVVVVARIIDMQNRHIIASATDIIPYTYLPECYRTAAKNCSFDGTSSFTNPMVQAKQLEFYRKQNIELQKRLADLSEAESSRLQYDAAARKAMTKARIVSPSGRPLGGVFLAPNQIQSGETAIPLSWRATYVLGSQPAAQSSTDSSSNEDFFAEEPYYPALGNEVTANGDEVIADPRYYNNVVVGATSRGNYDRYRASKGSFSNVLNSGDGDPVVYPANSYMHNTLLVRDTADESGYERVH